MIKKYTLMITKKATLFAKKKIDRICRFDFGEQTTAGCSAARLAHRFWEPGVGASNPLTPTSVFDERSGRLAQLGERLPYKQDVGGSSPSTPTTSFT